MWLEKLIFSLMILAMKFRSYFQAHTMVLMDQPLRTTLHWSDTSSRMVKWALNLFEFDLVLHSRPSIKAWVLSNFVMECTILDGESKVFNG